MACQEQGSSNRKPQDAQVAVANCATHQREQLLQQQHAAAAADVALAAMDAFLGSQPMMTMAIMMMTLWLELELELGL
ncbi:GM17291 [Drosophila sechellia]|uniref:GM17291 n=1 Tax=Drosophila sechellia TaxID=7238 RepID=B4I5K5_DROSE|nr:GM17291 [Drosophila sechellia]